MTALPTHLYDNPQTILEQYEQGDSMPTTKHKPNCLQCAHVRSSIGQWPCRRGNMPAMSGRCRKFNEDAK